MSDPRLPSPQGGGSSFGAIIPFLVGAILALVAANVYTFYQLNQFRNELDRVRDEPDLVRKEVEQTREELRAELHAELARANEATTESAQTNSRTIDSLKADFQAEKKRAETLSGNARVEAIKHSDQIAADLKKLEQERAQEVAAVSDVVSQVRTDTEATKNRIGDVSNQVATVDSKLTATQSDIQKISTTLKSVRGDVDSQAIFIATNATELQALKDLGDRNITPFSLTVKDKMKKVGDVLLQLKSADVKKKHYTVDIIADDKTLPKKDRPVNEALQFDLSRFPPPQHCELVVNEVQKDAISGYLSEPKAQQTRK